jgi:hypothetical protein
MTVINDTGIMGAYDGGPGRDVGTLNLCNPSVPQTPAKVKCAYGIRLTVWDRAIVGRAGL